jgi:hypothetical protein
MNPILRRVSALEARSAPRVDNLGRSIGEVLRDRARRLLAAEGREPEPASPRQCSTDFGGRPRTIGELLRRGRFER